MTVFSSGVHLHSAPRDTPANALHSRHRGTRQRFDTGCEALSSVVATVQVDHCHNLSLPQQTTPPHPTPTLATTHYRRCIGHKPVDQRVFGIPTGSSSASQNFRSDELTRLVSEAGQAEDVALGQGSLEHALALADKYSSPKWDLVFGYTTALLLTWQHQTEVVVPVVRQVFPALMEKPSATVHQMLLFTWPELQVSTPSCCYIQEYAAHGTVVNRLRRDGSVALTLCSRDRMLSRPFCTSSDLGEAKCDSIDKST